MWSTAKSESPRLETLVLASVVGPALQVPVRVLGQSVPLSLMQKRNPRNHVQASLLPVPSSCLLRDALKEGLLVPAHDRPSGLALPAVRTTARSKLDLVDLFRHTSNRGPRAILMNQLSRCQTPGPLTPSRNSSRKLLQELCVPVAYGPPTSSSVLPLWTRRSVNG